MTTVVAHAARSGIAALTAAVNLETHAASIARVVSAEVAVLFHLTTVGVLVPHGDELVLLGGHHLGARHGRERWFSVPTS